MLDCICFFSETIYYSSLKREYTASNNVAKMRQITPPFPLFSFAQFLTMFAVRSAVAACHNGRFLIPSLSLSSRFFAEAASATQGEEKPEEHGDPEVIDFIKKVGSPRDCHF